MPFRRALILIPLIASICWPQVDTGTIAGVVKDPSGAVVAGAAVVIRNVGTGAEHKVSTNSIGEYVSGPLPPGDYTVAAQSAGFRETVAKLTLTLNQRAVLDLALEVGGSDQQVRVTSQAPLVESETSTLDNVRTEQAVKDLPLNGRNFTELIGLTTGVMPASTQTQSLSGTQIRGVVGNSINGLGYRANQFLIDGLDNSENHNGSGVIYNPPIEAIQEFSVQTSVPPAEFGRGGGNINVRIRSGTRDLHGAAFEFLRNSALDAKNFFDPPGKITPFRMNQFGFALGGPVMLPKLYNHDRSKTFFFVDYEGIRVAQAQTFISTVPTPAEKAGVFPVASGTIYDPTTAVSTAQGVQRTPYPNNSIPANEISKVGQNVMNLNPDPNLSGIVSNYLYTPSQITNTDNYDIKIDHNFGANNQAFFRYSKQNTNQIIPAGLPDPAAGGNGGTFVIPAHQFVVSDMQTLSPHLVNEARAGIGRLHLESEQPNYGVNVADKVGIPGINGGNDPLRSGLSLLNITGFAQLGDSGSRPSIIALENWQYSDNLSWFTGPHSFKFGAQVIRRRYNLLQTNAAHGVYDFTGVYTQNLITPAKTGNGAADLLLGVPADGNINVLSGTRGYRRVETAFFVEDNWKIGQNLTVNWGLRYEAFPDFPWVEIHNRMSNFVPSLGQVVDVGTPQLPSRSATQTNWLDFGPRLGLAYKLGNHTVLRAAYGVFYESEALQETTLTGSNPPFMGSVAFTNDKTNYPGAITLARGFPPPPSTVFPTAGAMIYAMDPNFRIPYAQQWNAGLQREFRGAIVLSASYVGTKGTSLVLEPDINQPVPGPGAVASRRPYPGFSSIPTIESVGNSIFHSAQLSAEKRFSKGLSFLLSYTLSHAIDQGDFMSAPQNSLNFSADRGNGAYDVRNHFSGSWTWAVPGHLQGQLWNTLLGDWQLNGIASIYSGLPYTVTSAVNTLNGSGTQRANRIGSGVLPSSQRTLQEYFNIGAFVTPALYQFGNAGRDILSGPGTLQVDGSLFKNFHYTRSDRTYVQFRCEVFNVANEPQFNNPASAIGNPAAGTITSAGSKPTLQRTSRQIQLALKLYF